ncbi:MAG: hypothetical protein ACRYHQ_38975 [Janthinobacterium lividum]
MGVNAETVKAEGRWHYRGRLERNSDAARALASATNDGRRLQLRYGKVRRHLFTFLNPPEIAADNNSEREPRPTATYRKVIDGFRSKWGAEFYAGFRSVIGTAKKRGVDAIRQSPQHCAAKPSYRQAEQLWRFFIPHHLLTCRPPSAGSRPAGKGLPE